MSAETHKICPGCEARAKAEHRFCPACGIDLSDVAVNSGDPWLGAIIEGRYRLDEVIGTGAMGRVYRSTQLNLGKSFAIKVLHGHLTHDASSRDRFANEAHNAASLNHPNVVSVVDYGTTADELTYLAMEFVEGKSLEDIIAEEFPLGPERIVDLCVQILAALTEAHGLSILHRDLKPENILVKTVKTHGELVKVLDFGIAKLMDEAEQERSGLTGHGMVCGTPEYMSPEQARGQRLDARSDLYAVGVILYQMLAGRVPFQSESAIEVLQRHINEAPAAPSSVVTGVEVPQGLEEVCMRAISKDASERFPSAEAFRDALVRAMRDGVAPREQTCLECAAVLPLGARFCQVCGTPAPAPPSGRTRARTVTKISDFSLPAMEDDSLGLDSAPRLFPLPFIGRAEQLNWMHERIASPPNQVTVVGLRGGRGAGKSRTLDEFGSLASRNGWRVLISGAEPRGAAPSLWPIRAVVGQALELDLENVTTQLLGRSVNLAGLSFETLPGLAELFGLDGPSRGAELSVRRRECFSAATQALANTADDRPTLVLFDDIDRFDAASRTVLRRLQSSGLRGPCLVICSTSENSLAWLQGVDLQLPPLDAQQVRQVSARLPDELGELAPMSPMELTLRARLYNSAKDALEPAGNDAELVVRLLDQRHPLELAILEASAAYGEALSETTFDSIIQRFFSEQSPRDIDEALANLHIDGLLTLDRDGGRSFESRAVREGVYAQIPSRRRRQLHRIYATHPSVQTCLTTVAMHQVKSKPSDALASLEAAADAAIASFDDSKAASLLRAAIRGLRRAAAKPHDSTTLDLGMSLSMCRLECKLADVLRQLGQLDEALELVKPHEVHDHPSIAASSLLTRGRIMATRGEHDEAIAAFHRAFGPLLAEGELETILNTYSELARVHLARGAPDQGLSEVMEGLALCTLGEGPRAPVELPLWRYHLSISELHRNAHRLDEAVIWADHALFQAERNQDELAMLRTHAHLAFLMRLSDRPTSAEQHLSRALEGARNFGDRLSSAEVLLERAKIRAQRGELEEAVRCCEEALRLSEEVEWREGSDHARQALLRIGDAFNNEDERAHSV